MAGLDRVLSEIFKVARATSHRLMRASEQHGHAFSAIANTKVRRSSCIGPFELSARGRSKCTDTFTVNYTENVAHAVDTRPSLPLPLRRPGDKATREYRHTYLLGNILQSELHDALEYVTVSWKTRHIANSMNF